jgi:hypothetical protein
VVAPAPQAHPSYLHALSDLRAARGYLQRPANAVVKWDEKRAVHEIDEAINEIKRASIDDGKPLEDHPMVDAGLVWGGRLQKALELVETARRDVNQEEDNAFARGLKNRALGHIDLAARDIHEGMEDAGAMAHQPPPPPAPMPPPPPPPQAKHPAYLHALSDLRAARGFLERPANVVVKWDEKRAIHELDEAIGEIKRASIDDGKPLEDHPPLDRPTWGGRLQRSMELIAQARKDTAEEEDRGDVKGLRNRAEKHMANAERFIREGMEDAKKLKEEQPAPPGPMPGAHPAYGAALGNLRHARALLERPAQADVKWDEQNGIREIDAAIKEIKDARMDDGMAMTEHPPIEAKMVYRDRLREAMKLLHESAADIEGKEENGWAKKDRRHAIEHIRNAERAVKEAAEDRKEDRKEEKREEKKHGH